MFGAIGFFAGQEDLIGLRQRMACCHFGGPYLQLEALLDIGAQ